MKKLQGTLSNLQVTEQACETRRDTDRQMYYPERERQAKGKLGTSCMPSYQLGTGLLLTGGGGRAEIKHNGEERDLEVREEGEKLQERM